MTLNGYGLGAYGGTLRKLDESYYPNNVAFETTRVFAQCPAYRSLVVINSRKLCVYSKLWRREYGIRIRTWTRLFELELKQPAHCPPKTSRPYDGKVSGLITPAIRMNTVSSLHLCRYHIYASIYPYLSAVSSRPSTYVAGL
ncbi:hypothetical protein AB1N83_009771 [Pleurotus pulmonarius]